MPSARPGRFYAAIAGAIGAALLGLWQGVGTSVADRAFAYFDPKPAQQGPRHAPGGGETGATEAEPGPAASAEIPDRRPALEMILLRTPPLEESAVGTGAGESKACTAAIDAVDRKLDRQCERILIEKRGTAYALEGNPAECRSCGAVGQGWRCVARSAKACIIKGEGK